jgi:nucleoside-diphosphate-sugar epimerase
MLKDAGTPSVDILIHLEVKQHVSAPSVRDVAEFREVNVNGTQEWLQWAERHGIRRFVFFSSIKAAASINQMQDESRMSMPATAYGLSKLAAEQAVAAWANADPNRSALILRPAVVYGPGNQANMLSLVKAIRSDRYFLVGRNENVKSLISLRNLSAAVAHLLSLPLRGVHLFYLTDRESYSIAQIAQIIGELLGRERPFRRLPLSLAKRIASLGDFINKITGRDFPLTSNRLTALTEETNFSCAKLLSTGFVHPQTTRDGLKEMVDWYLQQEKK